MLLRLAARPADRRFARDSSRTVLVDCAAHLLARGLLLMLVDSLVDGMRNGVGNRQQIHRDERLAEARRTQTLALLVGVEAAGWDGTSIDVEGRQQIGNALHDIDAKERSVRSNPRLSGCPFEGGADALDGEG